MKAESPESSSQSSSKPWEARIVVSGLPSYVNEVISKFDYELEKIVLPHMAQSGSFPTSQAESMMKDAFLEAAKVTTEAYNQTYGNLRRSMQTRFQEEAEKVEQSFLPQIELLKKQEVDLKLKEFEIEALKMEKAERQALSKKLLIGAGAASILFLLLRK